MESGGSSIPVNSDEFRLVMGRFASGVCIVTTRWQGMDHAMTASAVASVSLEPAMVLFSVHRDSRLRDSLDDQPLWAMSILAAQARASAEWLASPGRPLVGQLSSVPHSPGEFSGAALIVDALAWVECSTDRIIRAGDHDVVFGTVARVERNVETTQPPLLHYQGAFHQGPGLLDEELYRSGGADRRE